MNNNNQLVLNFLIKKYGIKNHTAKKIMLKMGLHESANLANCNLEQNNIIKDNLNALKLDLISKKKTYFINKKQELQTYKGIRHIKGLPVNGQRTHTNGRTQKRYTWIQLDKK